MLRNLRFNFEYRRRLFFEQFEAVALERLFQPIDPLAQFIELKFKTAVGVGVHWRPLYTRAGLLAMARWECCELLLSRVNAWTHYDVGS